MGLPTSFAQAASCTALTIVEVHHRPLQSLFIVEGVDVSGARERGCSIPDPLATIRGLATRQATGPGDHRMTHSAIAVRLLGLCLALALVGSCRRAESHPRRPRIALVMKSLANEFYRSMEEGARAHQARLGGRYDLVTVGIKDELSVAKQVDLVDQMVARGADALVLVPADAKALVSAVRRAQAAGVLVVNVVEPLAPEVLAARGVRVPYVGPSNRKGALAIGQHLARKLRPGDEVAIIEGLPTVDSSRDRRAGFEEAMTAAGMRIVAVQSAHWEMAKASEITAALLNAHPGLRAVLAANDSMALGVVSALRAAGRTGQVHVVGFDNIPAVSELVRDGTITATGDLHGAELAAFGIDVALEALATGRTAADRETPVDLVAAGAP